MSHLKGIFRFWQKETGAKRVVLGRAPHVSFCFTCDVHFWCQVWRLPLQYFKKYSIYYFTIPWYKKVNIFWTKTDMPKKKMPFCCILKSLQINSNYFSFHRHFNLFILGPPERNIILKELLVIPFDYTYMQLFIFVL